jgi:hypothetical protein
MRKVLIIVAAVAALFVGVLPDAKAESPFRQYKAEDGGFHTAQGSTGAPLHTVVVSGTKSGEFNITGTGNNFVGTGNYAYGTAGWDFHLDSGSANPVPVVITVTAEVLNASQNANTPVLFVNTSFTSCGFQVLRPSGQYAFNCTLSPGTGWLAVDFNVGTFDDTKNGVLSLSGRLISVTISPRA